MIYDYDKKEIDLMRKRPTDCQNNRRMILPKSRTVVEEAEIAVRKEGWLKIVERYREEKCNKKGKQKVDNLTKEERLGMSSLFKIIKDK